MAIAFTEIRHGNDDGSIIVIKEGETVKGLPADVVKDLTEQGLIGNKAEVEIVQDPEVVKENEALKAQVEALQKELAAAKQTPTAPAK